MSFQPYPTRSGFIALGAAVIFGAAAIWLVNLLLRQQSPSQTFTLLVGLLLVLGLTGLALYWMLIALRLNYHLTRNGLAIQWGLGQQRIPISTIKNIVPGKNITTPANFKGLNIGGLHIGRGQLSQYGPLKFRSTAPLSQSLLVVTPNQAYVISPQNPNSFLKAWQDRQPLGPTQQWIPHTQRQWPLNIPLFADPLTWWLLGAAALLCLALLGYISLRYQDFPPSLPIHFNSLGRADRIADKSTLFVLPAAGAAVWIINAFLGSIIYSREKLGTYLLWSSTIAMQLCLWVAIFTITG